MGSKPHATSCMDLCPFHRSHADMEPVATGTAISEGRPLLGNPTRDTLNPTPPGHGKRMIEADTVCMKP